MSTMSLSKSGSIRWILAPATEGSTRGGAISMAALRVTVGILWLYNIGWKHQPNFGKGTNHDLYSFTKDAVTYPVFTPFSWVIEHVVLPNFTAFGWLVLVVETALAIMLLTGAFVRLAALIGVGQALAIGLSSSQAPHEWPWGYWMLIGIHVVLLFSAAGAVFGIDAIRGSASPGAVARKLTYVWGGIVTAIGVLAVIASLGDPFTAARGSSLARPELSVSAGNYNLLGALVVLAIGLLLLAAARIGSAQLGLAAAALGLVAGLSVFAQLAWTHSTLGGTNVSGGLFLTAAVIGAFAATRIGTSMPAERAHAHAA